MLKTFISTLLLLSFTFYFQPSLADEIPWEKLQALETESSGEVKKSEIPSELQEVLGKSVAINGFMLPMDYSAREITEFLLMPYIPACMHVPPPPPNQIIHVKMQEGKTTPPSFYPVKVRGTLVVQQNEDFESSYAMTATLVEELK